MLSGDRVIQLAPPSMEYSIFVIGVPPLSPSVNGTDSASLTLDIDPMVGAAGKSKVLAS